MLSFELPRPEVRRSQAVAKDEVVVFRRMLGRTEAPDQERAKVEQSLERSRTGWLDRLGAVFGPVDITADTWDELEANLVQADVGARTAASLVDSLRELARDAGVRKADELPRLLRRVMIAALGRRAEPEPAAGEDDAGVSATARPWTCLVVGVNGGGKTTTVAKLAHAHAVAGRRVVLVAADTFRAAAIDQLAAWGDRIGAVVIKGMPGGDPAAVVHDALASAAGREADIVLIDTAGRLHNQRNLMQELEKISAVAGRAIAGAPHEVLLVLDATTGQNGLAQAKVFAQSVELDGLVLAKLDSSARGGVAFSVMHELGLPIRWIGTGEALDDLAPFDPASFVDGLLGPAAA